MSFDIYEVAQKCLFQERIKRCLWTSSLCLKLNYLYVVCTYTLTLYITYVVLEGAFKGRINLLIHEIYEVAQKCLFQERIKRCLWTSSLCLKLNYLYVVCTYMIYINNLYYICSFGVCI